MPHNQFTCKICSISFIKYVPPGDKNQTRLYCNRSCQGKALRLSQGAGLAKVKSFTCKNCDKIFSKKIKPSRKPYQFCSTSCRSAFLKRVGANSSSGYQKRFEYLTQKFNKKIAKKKLSEERKNRSRSTSGENNPIYGKPRSHKCKEKLSNSVKKAYLEGRLTSPDSGVFVSGTYKGIRFRSSYEFVFLKSLENEKRIDIKAQVISEPKEYRVQ